MEAIVKRLVLRLWPDIAAGLHLPHWGRVASTPAAFQSAKSNGVAPLYCVDIQLLNDQGEDDTDQPVLQAVPLPAIMGGAQRGVFGFPEAGTLVELGFIRGLQSRPFIRSVLVEGLTLPSLEEKAVLIQHSDGVHMQADNNGNWERKTPADIADTCAHYREQIDAIKTSLAGTEQHLEAPKLWLGNGSDNSLQLLSNLMGIVQHLATTLATHTHKNVTAGTANSGAPVQAASFTTASTNTSTAKGKLDPMVK